MHLWRRIRGSKLAAGSKGFSSIAGAIFMVFIIGVLASSYFLWTLSQNTIYNAATRERNQLDVDRMSESAQVMSTAYMVNVANIVRVLALVKDVGPYPIQFTTIWVRVSNSTPTPWANYNYSQLSNALVAAGAVFSLDVNVPVSGIAVNSSKSYNFSSWLITTRGNSVPLIESTVGSNITISQTAQGIGSVAFDFDKFWHYEFGVWQPAQGTPLPLLSPLNYTVDSSKYTLYHTVLTDYDLLGYDIVLNGNSSIYIIGQHSGTVKYATWNLVNVTNNKIYPTSPVMYTLPYGVPTELYFGGSISSIDADNVYPLNILLFGTKGPKDYGQNIPFVSIWLK
jgi:hypothetical protein